MNAELDLLRLEAFHEPAHKLRREYFRPNRPHNHHRGHHRDDDGERLLRVGFALLREKTRVDRNEGDRSRASGHDVVEKVGQGESRHVGVGLRPRSEGEGDVSLARVTDHARQHHRPHQQHGSRERSVLVRGAEEAQQFRHRDPIGTSNLIGISNQDCDFLRVRSQSGNAAASQPRLLTVPARPKPCLPKPGPRSTLQSTIARAANPLSWEAWREKSENTGASGDAIGCRGRE